MQKETTKRERAKQWIGRLFVLVIFVILTAGLVRTVFFPKEINGYENRYAEKIPAFSVSGYMDGSFQDGVDMGLMDQVHLAQPMKVLYNQTKTRYLLGALESVTKLASLDKNRYVSFEGMCLYGGGNIVSWTRPLSMEQEALDRKIATLNRTFANHPELAFYTYYIEKDTDLNFETGEKSGLSDYLLQRLDLPEARKDVYSVKDFADFSAKFYQTDTHWNHIGSYEGYCQLHDLLGCEGELLRPIGEAVLVSDAFSGVKASTVGADGVFTEPFFAFPYEFPSMTVTINGASASDYGNQPAFLAGTAEIPITYGNFYGGDNGETVFTTGTQGRGNILVIGESFDNAVLKLLASHYDTLYSVDLRYYQHSMGRAFDLSAYTKEHGISTVLLMGNIDYFIQDTFDPEA